MAPGSIGQGQSSSGRRGSQIGPHGPEKDDSPIGGVRLLDPAPRPGQAPAAHRTRVASGQPTPFPPPRWNQPVERRWRYLAVGLSDCDADRGPLGRGGVRKRCGDRHGWTAIPCRSSRTASVARLSTPWSVPDRRRAPTIASLRGFQGLPAGRPCRTHWRWGDKSPTTSQGARCCLQGRPCWSKTSSRTRSHTCDAGTPCFAAWLLTNDRNAIRIASTFSSVHGDTTGFRGAPPFLCLTGPLIGCPLSSRLRPGGRCDSTWRGLADPRGITATGETSSSAGERSRAGKRGSTEKFLNLTPEEL